MPDTLATTYGSIDTSLPKIAWHELAQGFAFILSSRRKAATTVMALLAAAGVLAARKPALLGAGPAAAMA